MIFPQTGGIILKLKRSTVVIIVLSWVLFFVACFCLLIKMDQIHTEEITNEKIFQEGNTKENITLEQDTEEKKEDDFADLKAFMKEYYHYIQSDNVQALKSMVEDTSQLLQKQESLSKYVEEYQNLSYYVEQGADESSFIVYVTYQIKIKDIDTPAPGMTPYYLVKKGDSFMIYNNEDHYTDEMINAKNKSLNHQNVRQLTDKMNKEYERAVKKDNKLKDFLKESQ